MRHLPIYKAVNYVAPSLIVSCLLVSSLTMGTPAQTVPASPTRSVSATQPYKQTGNTGNNQVLVRNTTDRTEPVTAPVAAQKTQDKKAMGRCWKRLMQMIRDVNHAQSTKKQ